MSEKGLGYARLPSKDGTLWLVPPVGQTIMIVTKDVKQLHRDAYLLVYHTYHRVNIPKIMQ